MSDDVFADLYMQHYRRTCAFLLHLGVPPEVVPDLAQETFVRVYERIDAYRGDAQWSYLAKVARNVALNYIRERSAKKRIASEESLEALESIEESPVSPITPETTASEREQRERLAAALATLSAASRQCVLLRIQGFSYVEIAQILRISENAVKTRLRDARRDLARLFDDEQAK